MPHNNGIEYVRSAHRTGPPQRGGPAAHAWRYAPELENSNYERIVGT